MWCSWGVFGCSDKTFDECLEKKLFASKDPKDIADIDGFTAIFLWHSWHRELHGVWLSIKEGRLDSNAFQGKYNQQVSLLSRLNCYSVEL